MSKSTKILFAWNVALTFGFVFHQLQINDLQGQLTALADRVTHLEDSLREVMFVVDGFKTILSTPAHFLKWAGLGVGHAAGGVADWLNPFN